MRKSLVSSNVNQNYFGFIASDLIYTSAVHIRLRLEAEKEKKIRKTVHIVTPNALSQRKRGPSGFHFLKLAGTLVPRA